MTPPPWRPAPSSPCPARAEVHVWRAELDVSASQLQALRATLSPEESARGGRLLKGRDRFVAARGTLRAIIARYLDAAPASLEFRAGNTYGKPALSAEFAGALCFNVSHSADLALYAVSADREVGVDVEHIRTDVSAGEIAERFFSPRESDSLRALPEGERLRAFFECWTRKEAYLKAIGRGLFGPLEEIEVAVGPGRPAAVLSTPRDEEDAPAWSMRSLEVGADYAAAVVAAGRDWQLKCWQWAAPEPGRG